MLKTTIALALAACAATAFAQVPATGQAPRAPKGIKQLPAQQKPASNAWLLDADNDADRFRKLQIYLRGFDQPMQEVGQRYLSLYDAVRDRNWGLADYHWDKVKVTINGGLMKRPGRTNNAEGMFLDTVWPDMDKAIKSQDESRIKQQFGTVRATCMACHVAEKVGFINDSPIFRDTEKFAQRH